MSEQIDIKASCRNVGCDKEISVSTANASHHAIAAFLIHATVKGFSSIAASIQGFGELINLVSCSTEDDRRGWCFDIENSPERRRFV
jgi:hypothetical protein